MNTYQGGQNRLRKKSLVHACVIPSSDIFKFVCNKKAISIPASYGQYFFLGAFSTLNSIGSLQDLPQYLKSHSLSFFVALCHSLSLVAPHVVLSLVVIREMLWPYLAQFYADKNCTKISCEYSAIKRWLRCRDILRIQKISDARTIKKIVG